MKKGIIMNQENIGKFIAECRKEKNMTQQELAEKIGVTDRAISNWENGRRLPDLSLISLVASELDVSVAELLNGRKLNKEELEELKTTIDKLLEYNTVEEINKIYNYYCLRYIKCILLNNTSHNVIEEGLRYVHNDMCYPANRKSSRRLHLHSHCQDHCHNQIQLQDN